MPDRGGAWRFVTTSMRARSNDLIIQAALDRCQNEVSMYIPQHSIITNCTRGCKTADSLVVEWPRVTISPYCIQCLVLGLALQQHQQCYPSSGCSQAAAVSDPHRLENLSAFSQYVKPITEYLPLGFLGPRGIFGSRCLGHKR